MKRKQKQKVPLVVSAPTTTSIVDMGNPEVEQEYMTLANAGIYAQYNPVYTEPTGAPDAGLMMLGGAVDSESKTGMGRESIYENGNAANNNGEHPGIDNKHLSVISEDFENIDFSSEGINRAGVISPACDRAASIDVVVFSKHRFVKRSNTDDFALKKENKIATVVRRITRSLRTGEPDAPFKTTGDGANDARPPNDVVVSSLSDGRLNTIGAERGKPDNLTGRHMFVPPKLHHQPRGFAPASHNVPTHTKNTWGRTKMAQRSNSMKWSIRVDRKSVASSDTYPFNCSDEQSQWLMTVTFTLLDIERKLLIRSTVANYGEIKLLVSLDTFPHNW